MSSQQKTLLIGDSITEAFDTSTLLYGYQIVNKGVYGDNTAGVLARLQKDVVGEAPDTVYVLIGTNDLAQENSDEQIIENITNILHVLKAGLPAATVYLTGILPTRDIENRPNERIRGLNAKLFEAALGAGAGYFELYAHFAGDDGALLPEFTTDGLHISKAGYRKWAAVLRKRLRTQ